MRTRSLARYRHEPHAWFPDVETFMSRRVTPGVITVEYGGDLDFYVVDRGSASTLVVFHSALTARQTTYPVFSGVSLAEELGMNLVAVADPSVALGVDLAWYLGNRGQGKVQGVITRIIHRLLADLGSERTILFGASGGGFAAAYYAPGFQGSVALLLNPRLDLSAAPTAAIPEYLRVCHQAYSATPARRIRGEFVPDKVADVYSGEIEHYVAILQNSQDRLFATYQTQPFVDSLADTGKVFVRYGDWGVGHTPVPKPVILEALAGLANTDKSMPDAIRLAGFNRQTAASAA